MIVHLALLAMMQQQVRPTGPEKSYFVLVASAGTDEVALVRYGPTGLEVVHRTPIKLMPGSPATPPEFFTDTTGTTVALSSAHGLAPDRLVTGPRHLTLAADGRTYYVTTDHGLPASELVKVRIAADSSAGGQPSDTVQGREAVAALPGAIQVTPDGNYAWVASSLPVGDKRPSWITIVYLAQMVEVGRVTTCVGARGSRFNGDASRHYSLCMADDELVEIDTRSMRVTRQLKIAADQRKCAPRALALAPDGSRAYIACQESADVIDIDARSWTVARRIDLGAGAGEIEVTRDGRTLVATNPATQGVTVVDLSGGRAPVHIAARHRAPAGVTISPDDRFAFISLAGGNGEPGGIEVIDLATRGMVASVDYGRGLAGIVFWKVDK